MEFISRKVFLTKDLVPYDSDGDGVMDSLILSATTKSLLIPLRQSFDDIGIYETDDEEFVEIIDIGGIFDDSIDGDDITQPTTPEEPDTNDWDSGGSSQTDGQEIFYCSDTSATNYLVKTTETRDDKPAIVLTGPSGLETVYFQDLNGDFPTFTVDPTLCKYDNFSSDASGGGNAGTSGGGSPIITFSRWSKCDESWASYKSDALDIANAYCQNTYNSSVLYIPSGQPDGGSCTDTSQAFSGVKLRTVASTTTCCKSYTCNNGRCCPALRYRYSFCFRCS
jgi:hypothetical protein